MDHLYTSKGFFQDEGVAKKLGVRFYKSARGFRRSGEAASILRTFYAKQHETSGKMFPLKK